MKHLPSLVIAAALSGLVPAAWAAPVPANPVQRCRELLPLIAKAPPESAKVDVITSVGDTGCRYTNLRISISEYQGWEIGSLSVDRIDFKRAYDKRLPLTLMVRAEGIRFVPPALPAASAYQTKLTQRPMEIALDYAFESTTGILTLKEFTLSGESIGRFSVTGAIGGIDPDTFDPRNPAFADVVPTVSLNGLTVDFDNQGMIEKVLLLPALYALPNGQDDPEGAIAAAKTQATAGLAILAGAGVPQDSIAALSRFIQAMPQPRGLLRLTIAPEAPITATLLASLPRDDLAGLTGLIKQLNLTVSY